LQPGVDCGELRSDWPGAAQPCVTVEPLAAGVDTGTQRLGAFSQGVPLGMSGVVLRGLVREIRDLGTELLDPRQEIVERRLRSRRDERVPQPCTQVALDVDRARSAEAGAGTVDPAAHRLRRE
jgi:hypothetical protein